MEPPSEREIVQFLTSPDPYGIGSLHSLTSPAMPRRPKDAPTTRPAPTPLRIIASGTLFVTHSLGLPTHPSQGSVHRAHSVHTARGGSATNVLSLLAQFPGTEPMLVAPLGGNDEGRAVIQELQKEGVSTRCCKIWEGAGVPSAWVLQADNSPTRTIINHNPLPDISHPDFVSLLSPLLAPLSPLPPSSSPSSSSSKSNSNAHPSPEPPFTWLHFEGRSVKTTLSNMVGLDGLARERRWRDRCVFSVDVGRKARQGVEALLPHADLIFLSSHYASSHAPHTPTPTPRSFLLSFAASSSAPAHALIVAHWGEHGSALLSVPTREYFQSSAWWVEEGVSVGVREEDESESELEFGLESEAGSVKSVRTASDFYAGNRSPSSTTTYSAFSPSSSTQTPTSAQYSAFQPQPTSKTQTQTQTNPTSELLDEVGAQDAFVAGMIYALSRRVLPGAPYTPLPPPSSSSEDKDRTKGPWRLEECLRFATELSGRKARRRGWEGLAREMRRAGWVLD